MTLCSSTSSLNSLGWFGSALLSSLVAKSMRPVGTQSRFTTPLTLLLGLFPVAKPVITASGFAIAYSFFDRDLITIKRGYPYHGGILRRTSSKRSRLVKSSLLVWPSRLRDDCFG